MKQCVYCGKEYPDEAVTREIDGQPIGNFVPASDAPLTSMPLRSVVSIGLFAILSAFSGVGLAWMVIATIANHMNRTSGAQHVSPIVGGRGDDFVANSIPILVAGGFLGLVIGLVCKWISVKRKFRAQQYAAETTAAPSGS